MKVLVLGGSKAQLPGILLAQKMGHEVVVCDYLEKAIGHRYADESYHISTFDWRSILKVAEREKVDGIMTLGTDQPVLTGAHVAASLNLPSPLSVEVALAVTNKAIMKKILVEHQLPTVDYLLYEKNINDFALEGLKYPVVVKPIDSQGQRGIFYLQNPEEVKQHYEQVIMHSRDTRIMVETYYKNDEVTVSGWVEAGETTLLSIADRITFATKKELGICLAHSVPSKYATRYKESLILLTKSIVEAFTIKDGPIYFQYFLGSEGIKVNEIACRIGGAHEATFLPIVTGFDICKAVIRQSLGQKIEEKLPDSTYLLAPRKHVSVQLFFASPCKIKWLPEEESILAQEGVVDYALNYKVGMRIPSVKDATSRAGYLVVQGASETMLALRLRTIYKLLKIMGEDGENHLIHEPLQSIKGDR